MRRDVIIDRCDVIATDVIFATLTIEWWVASGQRASTVHSAVSRCARVGARPDPLRRGRRIDSTVQGAKPGAR